MAQREWLSEGLQREITEFVLAQPASRKRKQILDALKKYLKEHPKYRTPGNSTLLNTISRIRNRPDPEGSPWGLGAKPEVPREALPAVLRAAKESSLQGSPFTIRDARWCSKLSVFVKDSWTLRSWAWAYANRERACGILGQDFDTSDFDTILTTPPWELTTGYLTGEIKPVVHGIFRFAKSGKRVVPRDSVPGKPLSRFRYPVTPPSFAPVIIELDLLALCGAAHIAEMAFLSGIDQRLASDRIIASYSLNEAEIHAAAEQLGIESCYSEMPVVGQLGFSQEQLRVYTLWLHHLGKGPSIKSLIGETAIKKRSRDLNKRLKIVCELREWIQNHRLAKDSTCLLPNAVDPDFLDSLDTKYNLKPVELLRKVGYEV